MFFSQDGCFSKATFVGSTDSLNCAKMIAPKTVSLFPPADRLYHFLDYLHYPGQIRSNDQGCQIFLVQHAKTVKIYQIAIKFTEWPQNMPKQL
jgi:hypothetical protein